MLNLPLVTGHPSSCGGRGPRPDVLMRGGGEPAEDGKAEEAVDMLDMRERATDELRVRPNMPGAGVADLGGGTTIG